MRRSDDGAVAVFVAECYAPASGGDGSSADAARLVAACADVRGADAGLAYLGALIVPEDELAFHVFLATDAARVLEAGRRAGLRVERVVPSVAICCTGGAAGAATGYTSAANSSDPSLMRRARSVRERTPSFE